MAEGTIRKRCIMASIMSTRLWGEGAHSAYAPSVHTGIPSAHMGTALHLGGGAQRFVVEKAMRTSSLILIMLAACSTDVPDLSPADRADGGAPEQDAGGPLARDLFLPGEVLEVRVTLGERDWYALRSQDQ
jgi:hypothetical protein